MNQPRHRVDEVFRPRSRGAARQEDVAAALDPSSKDLVDDIERATISVGVVRGLADIVSHAGVRRQAFLEATGIAPERLDAPDERMPYLEFCAIVELALDMTRDEALGLHWAASLTERTLVPISHLLSHSRSLRDALEQLARYVQVVSSRRGYTVLLRGDTLVLRYTPLAGEPARLSRFSSEMLTGGFWRFIHTFEARAHRAVVRFAYPAPAHHAEYSHFFGHTVSFDQPFTELQFDAQLLEAPSRQRDDEGRDAIREVVEYRLMRMAQSVPWATRVRELLAGEGCDRRTDMLAAARALGVSPRTLRRRLASEGKSYDQVSSEARCALAKQLLRDPNRPIREVADTLGFSDSSTFHRAFRRWTGTTPKSYRTTLLGGD